MCYYDYDDGDGYDSDDGRLRTMAVGDDDGGSTECDNRQRTIARVIVIVIARVIANVNCYNRNYCVSGRYDFNLS